MEQQSNLKGPRLALIGAGIAAAGLYGWLGMMKIDFDSALIKRIEFDHGTALTLAMFFLWPAMFIGTVLFIFGCTKTWLFWGSLSKTQQRNFRLTVAAAAVLLVVGIALFINFTRVKEGLSEREIYCGQRFLSATTSEEVAQYQECVKGIEVHDSTSEDGDSGDGLQVRPPNPL